MMRILGFLLLVVGFVLFLSPISTLLGYIPFVGGIIKSGSFFLFLIAALLISLPVYLITLSIAWLVYHPRIGAILLIAGVVILAALLIYNFCMPKPAPPAIIYMPQQYVITHPSYY